VVEKIAIVGKLGLILARLRLVEMGGAENHP
jgi:hypothetical protein